MEPTSAPPAAGSAVDPELAAAIATIPAIDNHAHPTRVVGEGEVDDEFDEPDAVELDAVEPDAVEPDSAPDPTITAAQEGTDD